MPPPPTTQDVEQDRREQDRDCAKCLLPQPRAPYALVLCAIIVVVVVVKEVVVARITLKNYLRLVGNYG